MEDNKELKKFLQGTKLVFDLEKILGKDSVTEKEMDVYRSIRRIPSEDDSLYVKHLVELIRKYLAGINYKNNN